MTPERDPKIDPQPGDQFRKWSAVYTVTRVVMGCVHTSPVLCSSGWVGIQFFWRWAAEAEVVNDESI